MKYQKKVSKLLYYIYHQYYYDMYILTFCSFPLLDPTKLHVNLSILVG